MKSKGEQINASRITSTNSLQLHPTIIAELDRIIYENRFLWEPFIESSKTFDDFRESLKKKGCKEIPISEIPEITIKILDKTINLEKVNKTKKMISKA